MRRILWTTMVLAAVASLLIGCEQRTDHQDHQAPPEQELPEQSPPPPPDKTAPEDDDPVEQPTEPAPESPK